LFKVNIAKKETIDVEDNFSFLHVTEDRNPCIDYSIPYKSSDDLLTKDVHGHTKTIEVKDDLGKIHYMPEETNDEKVNQSIIVDKAYHSDICHEPKINSFHEMDCNVPSIRNGSINARFFCNTCHMKGFTSRNELNLHVAKVHDQITVNVKELGNGKEFQHSESRKHECPYCSKAFAKRHAMNKHIKGVHQGPVKCDKCVKEMSNIRNLKKHMERVHGPTRTPKHLYECCLCHKLFPRKSKLNAHVEKMTCSSKPKLYLHKAWPCSYEGCERVSTTKASMLSHQEKIHGMIRKYHCKKCKMNFQERSQLKQHRKDVHARGEKKSIGRPRKEWAELSERSKRRRELLLTTVCTSDVH